MQFKPKSVVGIPERRILYVDWGFLCFLLENNGIVMRYHENIKKVSRLMGGVKQAKIHRIVYAIDMAFIISMYFCLWFDRMPMAS